VAILLALGVLIAPAAGDASSLTLGFSSDSVLTQPSAAQTTWIGRASAEGARIIRLNVNWYDVAPATRPRAFRPADPSSPGYNWSSADASVRALSAGGFRVLVNVWGAPRWAEQGRIPRGIRPGTWQPDPAQFSAFATALARRYSGRYPDPLRAGSSLPRVALWQPWNEPNLNYYLMPQWTRSAHGYLPASPARYRSLLNAFYTAVKHVDPRSFVVTAGTAPYGDQPGGQRMQPVAFDRNLFCLTGSLRPTRCPQPPHLDALSNHPYGTGGPTQHAFNLDDVAVPDVGKLARVLRAAERSGHVLPRGPKRLWVTEISWDSSPPDPNGVPIQTQARWVEQSLYVLWRQGVDTVLWLQLVDSPPIPDYASTYQAGLYFLGGAPKPAALAYRFPFVAERERGGRVLLWGLAPQTGVVHFERRSGSGWRPLSTVSARAGSVFERTVTLHGSAAVRASQGGLMSLSWSVGA
jgi:hypothetical protein